MGVGLHYPPLSPFLIRTQVPIFESWTWMPGPVLAPMLIWCYLTQHHSPTWLCVVHSIWQWFFRIWGRSPATWSVTWPWEWKTCSLYLSCGSHHPQRHRLPPSTICSRLNRSSSRIQIGIYKHRQDAAPAQMLPMFCGISSQEKDAVILCTFLGLNSIEINVSNIHRIGLWVNCFTWG